MSLTLTRDDRSRLAALMGDPELDHYEALIADYIDSHREPETGRITGPPAKWKNLAAVIRTWWRRDQQKRGYSVPIVPKPAAHRAESPSERLERAGAIIKAAIHDQRIWIEGAAKHKHSFECQFGKVCIFAEHKQPLLPSVAEILGKLKGDQ